MAKDSAEDLEALKAELTKVKLERDILKKATALNTQDVTQLRGTRFDSPHHSKDPRLEWDEDWSI